MAKSNGTYVCASLVARIIVGNIANPARKNTVAWCVLLCYAMKTITIEDICMKYTDTHVVDLWRPSRIPSFWAQGLNDFLNDFRGLMIEYWGRPPNIPLYIPWIPPSLGPKGRPSKRPPKDLLMGPVLGQFSIAKLVINCHMTISHSTHRLEQAIGNFHDQTISWGSFDGIPIGCLGDWGNGNNTLTWKNYPGLGRTARAI